MNTKQLEIEILPLQKLLNLVFLFLVISIYFRFEMKYTVKS